MPVAARFHEIRDRVVAAVDVRFAEPVKLSFLKDNEPDPSRLQVDVEGVLRVGGGKETNMSGGMSKSWRSKLSAGKAELHLDASKYAGPDIRQGDAVCALSRRGEPWFDVLRVDDRGENRLVLELGEK
jgi:hypothetical protein